MDIYEEICVDDIQTDFKFKVGDKVVVIPSLRGSYDPNRYRYGCCKVMVADHIRFPYGIVEYVDNDTVMVTYSGRMNWGYATYELEMYREGE